MTLVKGTENNMAKDYEIIEQEGKPTVLRIDGRGLRNMSAQRQTINPSTRQIINSEPIEDEQAAPDPAVRTKKIEIGNIIRERINDLPAKQKLNAYGALGNKFKIRADNLTDLANQINQKLTTTDYKDIKGLASNLDINLNSFADKKKEIVDDQGNVLGIRKDMSSEKELAGPRNVNEQRASMKNKLLREKRATELKDELSKELDLEELERNAPPEQVNPIMEFFKNMSGQKKDGGVSAATKFLQMMNGDTNKPSQDVDKVEVPETGDTVRFVKQVGKYKMTVE